MNRRMLSAASCLCLTALLLARISAAAETWFEIKSPHFTVWANANDGNTRTLVWQLEQIRSALAALWPWVKVDLARPMLVLAVKDENSIKALAPEFWERKGAVHPVSVWVTGADRHYMVIRTDVQGADTNTLNPYTSTYFSYVNLILQSSFDRNLPLWFSRGLAGVLSNTIVRDNHILLGPPIPWHLDTLREQSRLPLRQLVTVTRISPEYIQGARLERFDAQSWAFVHFLMFGEQGAHRARINRLAELLGAGKDPDAAFAEAIGRAEDYETPFTTYVKRSVFSYQKQVADAGVSRDKFAARPIPPAEAAAGRAVLHVAMRRPGEAKALIAEARASNPTEPDAYVAEALQFDAEDAREEAKVAYGRAADLGSSNAYALYRVAVLSGPRQDQDTLRQMEKRLVRAVDLNPSFAAAYASLARTRAMLQQPPAVVMPLIARAVSLDPFDPWHRFAAAHILLGFDHFEEARTAVQVGLTLADTDAARQEAQTILASIQRQQDSANRRSAPATPAAIPVAPSGGSTPTPNAVSTPNPNPMSALSPSQLAAASPSQLSDACQSGDAGACSKLRPIAERACAGGQRQACLAVAFMQARGSGVPKDEARAFATMERLCDGGLMESCAQLAALLASHPEKPDMARARQLLTKSCDGGYAMACDLLKSFPKLEANR